MPLGELDLHLLGEGTHRRLWEILGPEFLDSQPLDPQFLDAEIT